jgi:uncharacterized membrane protein YcaP (DUF421 family)
MSLCLICMATMIKCFSYYGIKELDMNEFLFDFINASSNTITWPVMTARGILIFFFAILLIKLGGKRVFGKQTTIDIIIGITMGAILAKAITGNAPFIPCLITCTTMSLLHRMLAMLSYYSDFAGKIIKGTPNLLIKNGVMKIAEMRRANISENDLLEALHIEGFDDIKKVKLAYLERSGKISIVGFGK